jgi:hypothetical protein
MDRKGLLAVAVMIAALALSCLPALAQQHQTKMSALRPIVIETVDVLAANRIALDAGAAFEFDRELTNGAQYDNLRLAPLGARFGLGSGAEVGAALAFSANDADEGNAPDQSGLEGLALFGKLQLNSFSALRVGLVVAGDDDIAPYPNDGVDLFANLALQKNLENGLLYGEFGYKAQGGDFDTNSYFNYGIGFAMPVSAIVGLNVELVGEQAQEIAVGNVLDLVLGANLLLADNLRLAPYLSLGLNDAGPDAAVGGFLELRL